VIPAFQVCGRVRAPTLTVIHSIGYAGRSVADFMSVLKGAGVDRVVDVRALPLSRRKGFSKTALASALRAQGIEYLHVRAAGNPFRDQRGDIQRCLKMYSLHLDRNPEGIAQVERTLQGHRTALLCVEADASQCHRSVLIQRLLGRDATYSVLHL
jgi:uncharacterized protein (DUF488 family)